MKPVNIFNSRILKLAGAFWVLCLAGSCVSEPGDSLYPKRENARFSLVVEDIAEAGVTKTVLTDAGIETKITSLTVAVYSGEGELVEKRYLTSGFDDIRCMLGFDETFRIYALANMGDMRSSFPPSIAGDTSLETITYRIPGYTSGSDCINTRGIPMVGKLEFTVGDAAQRQIPMTRLMSKLQVHLACRWPGTFRTVKIYNLNRTLKPFGKSVAAVQDDILAQQEIHILDTDAAEGDFLFYIPENRQGTLPGIASSKDKSRDNDAVTGKDLKTYMEVVVTGREAAGASGTLTYRSYLGGNSSGNFDILRNSRYAWNIEYLPGNLQNNDWKHQNALSWKQFDYSLSAPAYVYLNERNNASLTTYSSSYKSGSFVERKQENNSGIPAVSFSFAPGNSVLGSPAVIGNYFYYTSLLPGTGTVRATCTDPFNPDGVILSRNIQVLDFGRQLFLRTPIGDYYDGDTVPIPYGTTWDNLQVGMRITRPGSSPQVICPITIQSDNLNICSVHYPSYGNELVHYTDFYDDGGKQLVFSHTFNEKTYSFLPREISIFAFYTDYGEDWHQLVARMAVQVIPVDTELITVNAGESEACWTESSIPFTATSTLLHNETTASVTDITASDDYQWTASGSVSGMEPRITQNGNTRSLSVSKAGDVTVTVTRKSDGSVSGSRTVTFNDKVTYRLDVLPKTWEVKVGDTFRTDVFTLNRDKYVNGIYNSSEPYPGVVSWSVKNGYGTYLQAYTNLHPANILAKAEGKAYLTATTSGTDLEEGYRENEITVNVTVPEQPEEPADVVTYAYRVKTTLSQTGIREGQSVTASARRYRKTYRNGTAVSDWEDDADVTSSGFTAVDGPDKVSIQGSTITALAAGSSSIRSLCSADDYADARLSIADAVYTVGITPSTGTNLVLGKKTQQTYTAVATKNGNLASGGSFEWVLSPADRATLNSTTGSSVTVTPVAGGNVTLTVIYKEGGSQKASATVSFKVIDNPLQLRWSEAGEPHLVAQRGLLEVEGLDIPEASVSYQIVAGSDKVRLETTGKNTYVSLLAAGSYTIRATASNGQTGTFSGTVTAPELSVSSTTLYANPDGSPAHTGTDGLEGQTLLVSYREGSTDLTPVGGETATGNRLHSGLLEELLAVKYHSDNSLVYAGGDGIWALDTYSSDGPLCTVTVSVVGKSTGVAPVAVNVRGVDPFKNWSADVVQKDDVEDWGLLKGYYSAGTYYNGSYDTSPVRASLERRGMRAFLNGKEAEADLQSVFGGDVNGGRVTWSFSQEIFAGFHLHQAGDVVLKAFVQNVHSQKCIYHPFARFRLFVHGAVGGRMVVGTSLKSLYMQAGFTGNIAGTPFANNTSGTTVIYSIGSTISRWQAFDRGLGTCPYYIANSQDMVNFTSDDDYILQIIPGQKTGAESYEPDGGRSFVPADLEAFKMSTPSNLRWGTVQSMELVRNGGQVLYMKGSDKEPGRAADGMEDCGYYVLHLLKDVQNTGYINGNAGWIRQ